MNNHDDIISKLAVAFAIGWFFGVLTMSIDYNKHNKFCPECGQRYRYAVEFCEDDGTALKEVEND